MSDVITRPAVEDDDLAVLWPALAGQRLNRDQVLVAVDVSGAVEQVLGGALLFDGGHGLLFVGELTLAPSLRGMPRTGLGGRPIAVLTRLVNDVLTWAQRRAIATVIFHCQEGSPFQRYARELGALDGPEVRLMTFPIMSYADQAYAGLTL